MNLLPQQSSITTSNSNRLVGIRMSAQIGLSSLSGVEHRGLSRPWGQFHSLERSTIMVLNAELRGGNSEVKDRSMKEEEEEEENKNTNNKIENKEMPSINGQTQGNTDAPDIGEGTKSENNVSKYETMTLAEELQLKSQQKIGKRSTQFASNTGSDSTNNSVDSASSKSLFSSIPSPIYLALAMILGIGFVGSSVELGTGKPLLGYYPTLAVIGISGPGLIACFLLAIKKAQEETIEDNEKFKNENLQD